MVLDGEPIEAECKCPPENVMHDSDCPRRHEIAKRIHRMLHPPGDPKCKCGESIYHRTERARDRHRMWVKRGKQSPLP
jgi:hypothetical protein